MNRGHCVRAFVFAGLATWFAACSGSDGKDGKSCSIQKNAAGVNVVVCPDGTTAPLGGTITVPAVDGGTTDCTITSAAGGAKKIVCPDGTEAVIPAAPITKNDAAIGTACTVVSNGDGTASMTCPGGDGGMVTVTIKNALVNYATMSADEKAELDMKVSIGSVTVPTSGKPVVTFRVTAQTGDAITGLPAADMRFALLKLVAATKGGNDTWVSYMAANPTSTAGTETAAVAATASSGALLDNGDGSYTYTFARNVLDSANAGTVYDANAVHRLVMLIYESGNPFAPVNLVKDWVPALGLDVTGKADKVDGKACLECHGSFRAKAGGTGAFHGGARYDVGTCVACHNDQRRFTAIPGTSSTPKVDLDAPGVVDPTTGAWTGAATLVNGEAFINLPVFIHSIHMGEELALKGGSYTGMSKPYEVTYPQDVRNCVKCHSNVAQADNFKSKPSRRVCGSCHDSVSFAPTAAIPAGRTAHAGGPATDDSTCATCHPASAPKTQIGFGVLDSHVAIAAPGADATNFGGTNTHTNAGWIPAAGTLPAGAAKITYDLKSVTRDAAKHPSIVFRFIKDGTPVVFNTYAAGTVTEMMDGFVNSPSVYFAYAVPEDGIKAPADFNATASAWIKGVWNGSATNASMTGPDAAGYYTITLTATIPDTAVMFTGGVGYTYGTTSSQPLTQINLPAFPYGDATVVPGCATGQICGGLIVPTPDVSMVATDAATAKAYTARRPIVSNTNCVACHEQLGANPTFHAGQRNDGATCAFCHTPNRTSNGWSAGSSSFVHGIHGASIRTQPFNWQARCPAGTSVAAGTCTQANADSYANITYPGVLSNCRQCHLPGTYDFSASASAAALPNLLVSTVATGTYAAPDIGISPNVVADGVTNYGLGFSISNVTSGTVNGVVCTTDAPCVCSTAAPCNAAPTTLAISPITAACSACHNSATELSHMRQMGGTFYGTRLATAASPESCMMCHGPGTVAAIAAVHDR